MAIADEFADVFKSVTKDLHTEKKRRQRDARRVHRQPVYSDRVTLKDLVFDVLPEAVAAVSDNGRLPFPCRNLYYAVRPLIQEDADRDLEYGYFSQTLVVEYQRIRGPILGMYRDPRGELHEPHTGKSVRLGTREVASYVLPEHVFDKILYVEKEGLTPIFKAAQLGERYDLAIAAGKGQPVEAVRDLFERAEAGDYRLFVLHDADPAGYSIRRTIAEATARMPGYHVEVIDLGLKVGHAVDRGLLPERFTRRKRLPRWMPPRLDETEREWFEGSQISYRPPQWECTRVELNALLAPDLIAYVEAGLAEHDATAKVIPPADKVTDKASEHHRSVLRRLVEDAIADLIDVGELVDDLAVETGIEVDVGQVEEALADNPPIRWGDAVTDLVDDAIDDDAVTDRIRAILGERGLRTEAES